MAPDSSAPKEEIKQDRGILRLVLVASCTVLLILPFITTTNDLLAIAAAKLHLDVLLEAWVVPAENLPDLRW